MALTTSQLYFKSDSGKAAVRRYQQSEKGKAAAKRAYRKRIENGKIAEMCRLRRLTELGSDYHVAEVKKYAQHYPNRVAAGRVLHEQIRLGKIVRPAICNKCGKTCKPHSHHWNYDEPTDVIWLCARCHASLHAAQAAKLVAQPN